MRRFLRKLKHIFTLDGYATAPVWVQLLVLSGISTLLILAFSPFLDSINHSFFAFMDAEGFVYAQDRNSLGWRAFFVMAEFLIGFIIAAFVISLLTSALEIFIRDIRSGARPFKKSGHIVIVGENEKLPLILEEINLKFREIGKFMDVVVLVESPERVARVLARFRMKRFSNLTLAVKQGDLLNIASYLKINFMRAFGLLVLVDGDQTDPFLADNANLQIVTTLMNHEPYQQELLAREAAFSPQKCLLETRGAARTREIALARTSLQGRPFFSIVDSQDFISKILSRSIVNTLHFKIYSEIFSFRGHEIFFIDPALAAPGQDLTLLTFEELHLRFDRGVLLGYSRPSPAGLSIVLGPWGEKPGQGDWLIFLAFNERSISYDASLAVPEGPAPRLDQPSEIESRRICMLGERFHLEHLFEFMDAASRESFRLIVKPGDTDYLDPDFLAEIEAEDYDNVIVNLSDEHAFKLVLYVEYLSGAGLPGGGLLDKLIAVVESPVLTDMLTRSLKRENVISSVRLSADYMTQIVFQRNLVFILEEIIQAKGYEFNLLTVDGKADNAGGEKKNILPADDLAGLKKTLLANRMIYAGVITTDGRLVFESKTLENAAHIVILSRGSF